MRDELCLMSRVESVEGYYWILAFVQSAEPQFNTFVDCVLQKL